MTFDHGVTTALPGRRQRSGGVRPVVVYVALAWGLSWASLVPVLLAGGQIRPGIGWPTHLPALVGPAVAAVVVTATFAGRTGLRELGRRVTLARFPARWWLVTVSPLVIALATVAVLAVTGRDVPTTAQFGVFSGAPAGWAVLVAVLVNGFGEETGWRGYLLPALQRRFSPLGATLVLAAVWGVWHLPMFAVLSSFRGFTPVTLIGWWLGLLCGAVLLTWLFNGTGGSVLAVALWHAAYNLTSATAAAQGVLAAVETAVVMVVAVVIVVADLRSHDRAATRPRPVTLSSRSDPAVQA